jgi:phosphoribosyl-ATP pyrophosphohydrolase/phosphoribosyl-AMP cyclohydrolase
MELDQIHFDDDGLVPVIVQDAESGQVLSLAYANREALEATLASGQSTFFSRSRQQLWRKGETSGHIQEVQEILLDCDHDAVLYRVKPHGPACHTGAQSCFHHPLTPSASPSLGEVLEGLYRTLRERIETLPEGSYTARLHREGLDRMLKKIGEEAAEVILAAKNHSQEELTWEASDLLFHLFLVLAELELPPSKLAEMLHSRQRPRPD